MIRRRTRQQILELLDTVQEGVVYAAFSQEEGAGRVAADCQSALHQVAQTISQSDVAAAAHCRHMIQDIQEKLGNGVDPNRAELIVQQVGAIQEMLWQERTTLEIVFLPYKLSMWDCMDSVWRAASDDPACDCYVMPIPYYERRQDKSLGTMHYEGALFPPEVHAIDYRTYDFACRRPDIVYIHNPYDERNLVTSVAPAYYSYELKKYTDTLVYIPYYISGCVKALGAGVTFSPLSAYQYVDYIAAQSEEMKRGFVDLGIPPQRVLALGNPKFDAVINRAEGAVPADWLHKLADRTVFLVNTSLTDLLAHNENWLPWVYSLLNNILSDHRCAVIWRPHPLMEATLKSMRPGQFQFYQQMKRQLCAAEGFIYDEQGDVMPAFRASHALISDYSSIMWQFGVTGKPVLCLTGGKSDRAAAKYRVIDDSELYFCQDGTTLESFVSMVQAGRDPKREQRIAALKRSTSHLDGRAGELIHNTVTARLRAEQSIN